MDEASVTKSVKRVVSSVRKILPVTNFRCINLEPDLYLILYFMWTPGSHHKRGGTWVPSKFRRTATNEQRERQFAATPKREKRKIKNSAGTEMSSKSGVQEMGQTSNQVSD